MWLDGRPPLLVDAGGGFQRLGRLPEEDVRRPADVLGRFEIGTADTMATLVAHGGELHTVAEDVLTKAELLGILAERAG